MYCNKQLSSVSVDANPPEVLFDSLPASGLPYNDRPNGHVGFTQSLQQWRNGLPGKVLQKTNFLSYEVWKSQNLKTKFSFVIFLTHFKRGKPTNRLFYTRQWRKKNLFYVTFWLIHAFDKLQCSLFIIFCTKSRQFFLRALSSAILLYFLQSWPFL